MRRIDTALPARRSRAALTGRSRSCSRRARARATGCPLAATARVNSVMPLPGPTADDAVLPFMDPGFATSVCRYDLASGPLQLRVRVSQAYTSVSFYARSGVAYYAINDRAAGRRIIELDLMTSEQRAEVPEDEEVTAADRLIVESPTPTGLILIRTFGPEPGLMPMAHRALSAARC